MRQRLFGLSVATVGAVSVVEAGHVADLVAGESRPDRRVVRVLGARQLVQGIAVLAGRRSAVRASAVVDAIHALSMVALAVVSHRHRRAAMISAVLAAGSAVAAISVERGAIRDASHRRTA